MDISHMTELNSGHSIQKNSHKWPHIGSLNHTKGIFTLRYHQIQLFQQVSNLLHKLSFLMLFKFNSTEIHS